MIKITKTEFQIIRILNTYERHRGGQASNLMLLSQAATAEYSFPVTPVKLKPQEHSNHLWI